MKNKIISLMLGSLLFLLSGCEGFLDVRPKAEVIDRVLFTTEEGFEDALYGVYSSLRSNDLYGKKLSVLFPEAMARNFTAKGGSGLDYISIGDFENAQAKSTYNSVWKIGYQSMGYINNILDNLPNVEKKGFRHFNLYKGEALTLRAFLHFDLLRFFAVDINSTDPSLRTKGIPYVIHYSYSITPFYSVDQVYQMIIDDLTLAESLLTEDETLLPAVRTNQGVGFTSSRMIHANLYAAQALLARVYWMKGDLATAAIYAKKVIDSGKFPLMKRSELIQPTNGILNLKETVWGLYAPTYAANCYSIFGKADGSDRLFLDANKVSRLYLDSQGPTPEGSDLRYSAWFGATTEVNFTCRKLINSIYEMGNSDYTGNSYLGVNLIRIPEMYYIMAEALLQSDPQGAMFYLDQVIDSRGMVKFQNRVGVTGITEGDIYLERQKEFYGEGQQWFNMKRLKKDIVITSSNTLDGKNDKTYRFLIPTSEDLRE